MVGNGGRGNPAQRVRNGALRQLDTMTPEVFNHIGRATSFARYSPLALCALSRRVVFLEVRLAASMPVRQPKVEAAARRSPTKKKPPEEKPQSVNNHGNYYGEAPFERFTIVVYKKLITGI